MIHKVMKMKRSIKILDAKIKGQKTNSQKKPFREEKKELKKQYDFRQLNEVARSYSNYRPIKSLFKVGKLKKDVLEKYKNNFGFAEECDVLQVVPVEAAFDILHQLCVKDCSKHANVQCITNKILKKCIPDGLSGINNNLVIYFIEALCRAADLSLSTRQVTLGTEVYKVVKKAGGFGITQFVDLDDRLNRPLHKKLQTVTHALKYQGNSEEVTHNINKVLVSFGQEPIRDLTMEERRELQSADYYVEQKEEDEIELIEEFRNDLSSKKLLSDFHSEEFDEEKDNDEISSSNDESWQSGNSSSNSDSEKEESGSIQNNMSDNGKNTDDNIEKDINEEDSQEKNNEDGDEDANESNDGPSEPKNLFKKNMSSPFSNMSNVLINVFTTQFWDDKSIDDVSRVDHHVLMVYCVITRFTLFQKVIEPYNLHEIGNKLNDICGIFGCFQSVSYYKHGICFNRERYIDTNPHCNKRFDGETNYGHYQSEIMGEDLFEMVVSLLI